MTNIKIVFVLAIAADLAIIGFTALAKTKNKNIVSEISREQYDMAMSINKLGCYHCHVDDNEHIHRKTLTKDCKQCHKNGEALKKQAKEMNL